MARLVTDLPEPEFADHRQDLALVDVEGDAVDRAHDAVLAREVHRKIAHFQKASCVHPRSLGQGVRQAMGRHGGRGCGGVCSRHPAAPML